MKNSLFRCLVAEFLGTAFLVSAVVGSGVMGERLANGNVALALLANTIATGAALIAIILAFGPISGAHLNPVITLADVIEKGLPWTHASQYAVVMTHPGVGAITALAFTLIIGNAERFHCGKQVASYLGLVPLEESSGNRRRLGHITKQGSSIVRFLLVEAAQVTVRSLPDWRSKYVEEVRFARGTARKSRWCAVEHREIDWASCSSL